MTKMRAVLRRRWPVLVAGLVLGALAGAFSAALSTEQSEVRRYRVRQLIVANSGAAGSGGVEQDALRVTRGEVVRAAAAKLGLSDASSASGLVVAEANSETNTIEVSGVSADPADATKRVTAFVDAFLETVNGDVQAAQDAKIADYKRQIDAAEAQLAAFDAANPGIRGASGAPVDPILSEQRSSLQAAVADAEQQLRNQLATVQRTLPYSTLGPDAPARVQSDLLPIPTGLPFRVAFLGLFGIVLASGLIVLVERFVPRIDTRDELVAAIELPVLAEVGYFSRHRLPRDADGALSLEGAWAEPYRRIRSAIQFLQATGGSDNPAKVIMFTSPSPSEGKSTTSAVTALALGEAGVRTLVVGGDFRRPSVHRLLGTSGTPGIRELAQLAIDRPTPDQIVHTTGHDNVFVAPSGGGGKDVVGLADAARTLISTAVSEGATVVVDTSPLEVANDAIDLLPVVDDVIIVVRSGRTNLKSLDHTLEQLRLHGAQLKGTVLIGAPGLARRQYYYEGYYGPAGANVGPGDKPGGSTAPPEPGPPPFPPGAVEPSAFPVQTPLGPQPSVPASVRNDIPPRAEGWTVAPPPAQNVPPINGSSLPNAAPAPSSAGWGPLGATPAPSPSPVWADAPPDPSTPG